MTEPCYIKPLGNAAIVELVEEEKKAGDLYLPQTTGGLSVAIVLSLPAFHDRLPVAVAKDLSIADRVLFNKNAGDAVSIGSNRYVVPLSDIVAVLNLNQSGVPPAQEAISFFDIPKWNIFVEDNDSHKTWNGWENVIEFTFLVRSSNHFFPSHLSRRECTSTQYKKSARISILFRR